jgi:hypothetical protein
VNEIRDRLGERAENQIASIKLRRAGRHGLGAAACGGAGSGAETVAVMVFAVQRLEIKAGTAEERELRLRAFVVREAGEAAEVDPGAIGDLVRSISGADRQAVPSQAGIAAALPAIESSLIERLRREPVADPNSPPLAAIWPVTCALITLNG